MPNSTDWKPQIVRMCSECGAFPNARCPQPERGAWGDVRPGGGGCPGTLEAWTRLADLPEDIIEALRAKFLQANTVDADFSSEIPPPGIKDDAEERMREVLTDNVVLGEESEGDTPEDTLG